MKQFSFLFTKLNIMIVKTKYVHWYTCFAIPHSKTKIMLNNLRLHKSFYVIDYLILHIPIGYRKYIRGTFLNAIYCILQENTES